MLQQSTRSELDTTGWLNNNKDKCILNLTRNCQIVFHREYSTLQSHQQSIRVPITTHPQPRSAIILFNFSLSYGYKMVSPFITLICISLMTNETQHLFMCLLAIHLFLWWSILDSSPLFFFFNWVVRFYWVNTDTQFFTYSGYKSLVIYM